MQRTRAEAMRAILDVMPKRKSFSDKLPLVPNLRAKKLAGRNTRGVRLHRLTRRRVPRRGRVAPHLVIRRLRSIFPRTVYIPESSSIQSRGPEVENKWNVDPRPGFLFTRPGTVFTAPPFT